MNLMKHPRFFFLTVILYCYSLHFKDFFLNVFIAIGLQCLLFHIVQIYVEADDQLCQKPYTNRHPPEFSILWFISYKCHQLITPKHILMITK